jgi:microsomal dipeptidase-like Zn-dependent dipeptidase
MAGHGPSVADVVKAIDAIGPEMVVLSTDYGWNSELPRPAAGLHAYVDALWDVGASEGQLRQMVCDNPARLLGMAG